MQQNNKETNSIAFQIGLWILTAFFVCTAFYFTLVPYLQMVAARSTVHSVGTKATTAIASDAFMFSPALSAQHEIRYAAVNTLSNLYQGVPSDPPIAPFDVATQKLQEYVGQHPSFVNFTLLVARAYDKKWTITNDATFLHTAETYYQKALTLSPQRQETLYFYALNLGNQGKVAEAKAVLQGVATRSPELLDTHYFLGVILFTNAKSPEEALTEFEIALSHNVDPNPSVSKKIYFDMLSYFYKKHDIPAVLTVLLRSEDFDPKQASTYASIASDIKKTGVLPAIDFK